MNPWLLRRPGDVWGVLGLAIGGLAIAGCASTGTIQGRIHLPAEHSRETTEAVVMAWRRTAEIPARGNGHARIIQRGGRFVPRVLVVRPGTTVVFENRDNVYHNAFCVFPTARFDLGKYAPGQMRTARFDSVGTFNIFCEMHSEEAAFVVVAPDRWYTRPTPDGRFVLQGVPIGSYVVRAWHPALGALTESVEVASMKPAVVDFGQ